MCIVLMFIFNTKTIFKRGGIPNEKEVNCIVYVSYHGNFNIGSCLCSKYNHLHSW